MRVNAVQEGGSTGASLQAHALADISSPSTSLPYGTPRPAQSPEAFPPQDTSHISDASGTDREPEEPVQPQTNTQHGEERSTEPEAQRPVPGDVAASAAPATVSHTAPDNAGSIFWHLPSLRTMVEHSKIALLKNCGVSE